jgi:hypothetical protein
VPADVRQCLLDDPDDREGERERKDEVVDALDQRDGHARVAHARDHVHRRRLGLEQLTEGGQFALGVFGDVEHGRRRLARRGQVAVGVAGRDRGLEVDHRDRVPDDVVELACGSQPLGEDALAGAFLLRVVGRFVRPASPGGGGHAAAHEQPGDAGGGRQERREAVGEGAVGHLLERHAGQ